MITQQEFDRILADPNKRVEGDIDWRMIRVRTPFLYPDGGISTCSSSNGKVASR